MAGNHEGLTDSDIGMVDALSTIMEVFVALGIEPSVLSGPLEFQRDAQLAAGRTNAALVLGPRTRTAAASSPTVSTGTAKGLGLRTIIGS
jgi:hypothetical protein